MQNLNMNQFTKRYMKTKDKLLHNINASRLFITLKKTIPHNNILQVTDNPKHAHSPKLFIAAGQVSVS